MKGMKMKTRAFVVIDYEIDGGIKEAAAEQKILETIIDNLVQQNTSAVRHDIHMRERRGNGRINFKTMRCR